ncbi:FkbM family methyltransferase [Chitinophagales bacterium]|nr:FkbM family methyltransferase [Chitinophagales bacterium]
MNFKALSPNFLKAIYRYFSQRSWIAKIESLNIENSGTSDDLSFVKVDGLCYFGYSSDEVSKLVYRFFLKKELKRIIHIDAFGLVLDVLYRNTEFKSDIETLENNKFVKLQKGDVVLEGGAYIGLYAMQISKKVGNTGKVIAVEAIEENFNVLKKNLAVNNITNIIPVNCAIWEKEETLTFYRRNKQIASFSNEIVQESNQEFQVSAKQVDTILIELGIKHIDYVRLQLNGAEINGLRGMEETLKQRPGLMIAAPYKLKGQSLKIQIADYLKLKGFETSYHGVSVYFENDKIRV